MGREIRRVPPGWEHPKKMQKSARGYVDAYIPMYDRTWHEAMQKWLDEYDGKWQEWEDPEAYEWPPVPDVFRPPFTEEPTCYQIYETVSEGTPVSPVFTNLDDLVEWLVDQGHSRKAAEAFAKSGWVPSMMIDERAGVYATGIDCALMFKKRNE